MSSNKAVLVLGFVTAVGLLGCTALSGLGGFGGYGGDSCAESYQGTKHKCGEDCCDDEDPSARDAAPDPAPTATSPVGMTPKKKPPVAQPDFLDASLPD